MRYLLGEVKVLVVGHASGDVVDDLSSGSGVVRSGLACAAISLKASHETTVSGQVHLNGPSTKTISSEVHLAKYNLCVQLAYFILCKAINAVDCVHAIFLSLNI